MLFTMKEIYLILPTPETARFIFVSESVKIKY